MQLTPEEMLKHALYLSMKNHVRLTVTLRNQARMMEALDLEPEGEATASIDAEVRRDERRLFEQLFGDDGEGESGLPSLPIRPNGQS